MSRILLGLAASAVLAWSAPAAAHPEDDMHELPSTRALVGPGDHVARGVTLYVNGGGARLTGGWDDSAADVSSIALRAGDELVVPAWQGGARRWRRVIDCVRDRFGEFAVDVVTDRPASGDYIMIVVGGDPALIGMPDSVSGIAPYTGSVLRTAVGYVFSESLRHDVEATCVSILHEAGHAMGLDHAYLCEDPMSYLWGCGEKRFRDEDAYCGEGEPRSCGDGTVAQNSWRHLAALVGLRDGGTPPDDDAAVADAPAAPDDDDLDRPWHPDRDDRDDRVDPGADDDVAGGPRGRDADDVAAPAVAIDGGDDVIPGERWIRIVVRASDPSGIADLELGWASEDAQYVWSCGAIPEDLPVHCWRDGDTFVYEMLVGTGLRAVIARATDGAGNQAVSEPRVIYFE